MGEKRGSSGTISTASASFYVSTSVRGGERDGRGSWRLEAKNFENAMVLFMNKLVRGLIIV